MKRVLKAIKQFFTKPRVQATKLNGKAPNLRAVPVTIWYEPKLYEPSPFDLKENTINPMWLDWYMERNGVTLSTAMLRGHQLKKQLVNEFEPPVPKTVPDILVEFNGRLMVGLAWLKWYRNEFGVSYQEAYYQGVLLTTRYKEA